LLTGDSNIIHLKTAAVCKITDPVRYHFSVVDADRQKLFRSLLDTAVQGVLAHWQVDEALYRNVGRLESELQLRFTELLQKADIGVAVVDFIVESKAPPQAVVSAFTNVLETELRKDTAINEARAEAETLMTEAVGKAAAVVADAELYKKRLVSGLQADAHYFSKLSEEVRKSRLTVLPLYRAALSHVLENAGEKIILSKPGNKETELRLRLGREKE
jgi:membrane protease subunit HflK